MKPFNHRLILLFLLNFVSGAVVELLGPDHLFTPLGCSELSPFGTLSFCFVRCTSAECSNAKDICESELAQCGAIVRYDKVTTFRGPLNGKLVQLVSLDIGLDPKALSRSFCYDLGRNLSLGDFAVEIKQYDYVRQRSFELYKAKQGALLFLHMSKNGGTTMCAVARANKLNTPVNEDSLALFISVMGKNCNPATFQMHAWFGSKQQQLDYIRKFDIQFYSNEKHFSRPDDIPFGDVMITTTLRHPIGRLFSLFKDSMNPKSDRPFVGSRSDVKSILNRWHGTPRVQTSRQLRAEWRKRVQEENTYLKQNYKSSNIMPIYKSKRLKKSNKTIDKVAAFEAYLARKNPNMDIHYLVSMLKEPPLPKNYAFCANIKHLSLEKQLLSMSQRQNFIMPNPQKNSKGQQKSKPKNKSMKKNPCNMTLFHLQRNYDSADLLYSISMLNKFNFISIFEGMDIMTPVFTKRVLGWKRSNINSHRSGTRGISDEGFSTIADHPKLIELAVVMADYGLDLYRHGTRLGCYHYYQIMSQPYVETEGEENVEVKTSSDILSYNHNWREYSTNFTVILCIIIFVLLIQGASWFWNHVYSMRTDPIDPKLERKIASRRNTTHLRR